MRAVLLKSSFRWYHLSVFNKSMSMFVYAQKKAQHCADTLFSISQKAADSELQMRPRLRDGGKERKTSPFYFSSFCLG